MSDRPLMQLARAGVLSIVAAGLLACAACSEDPCSSGTVGESHRQLHPENYLMFSCGGGIYIADREPKDYIRADVDLGSFQTLPFRFGYDKDRFYYVARGTELWGHNELRVLPQIDIGTAEVVNDNLVRDKGHFYTVLNNQILVEDLAHRFLREERFR